MQVNLRLWFRRVVLDFSHPHDIASVYIGNRANNSHFCILIKGNVAHHKSRSPREDIMVYQLQEDGEYGVPEIYTDGEIASKIFENIKIPLGDIFR